MSIAMALGVARRGVTVDEPSRLPSSCLYWRGDDTLPPRDMPHLLKISAGWVPHLLGLPVPATLGQPGHRRTEWDAASGMMTRYHNYYQVFRPLEPIARRGHSIYAYRIDLKFH